MKRLIFVSTFLIFFILPNLKSVNAEASFELLDAKSAIMLEAETGKILYAKNEHEKLAPASMTKIMTMTLICEAISTKRIDYNTIITASEYAVSMGGSQVYLKVGEQLSVDDMLKCIAIASANDCAVAMAEHLYGSEEAFVGKMNEKIKELGLENTHFVDCTGLTKINHYSSAYDMAQMARHLINNYGDIILKYTSIYDDYIRQDTASPFWLVNTNKLIGKVEGVDGLKTGWNDLAKYCLTATAKRGDMRLITSVMGYDNPLKRNTDSVKLLNYGFANYEKKVILKKGTVIYEVDNYRYKPNKFAAVTLEDVSIIIPKGSKEEDVSWEIIKRADFDKKTAGSIDVYYGDEKVGETAFNALEEIKKKPFYELWLAVFIDYLT